MAAQPDQSGSLSAGEQVMLDLLLKKAGTDGKLGSSSAALGGYPKGRKFLRHHHPRVGNPAQREVRVLLGMMAECVDWKMASGTEPFQKEAMLG